MVGVPEDDLRIDGRVEQLGRVDCLHRAPRSHGHEHRGFHRAMGKFERAGAGGRGGIGLVDGEHSDVERKSSNRF